MYGLLRTVEVRDDRERVELALREGGPPKPLATPPLEMMVDLRGGVGPPPRDDGACQGGVDRPPP